MPAPAAPTSEVKEKQPKGLFLLFIVEMWERASFYGMKALLTLYLTHKTIEGGFGWSRESALTLYGIYGGLVYITPLFGGALSDRYLGQRRAVLIGGFLMMCGQFALAAPGLAPFFAGLGLLIVGNGFFKPNIATMVGALYRDGDPRRDGGFTIFYLGINVGALSPFVCGLLQVRYGFRWGFGAAGLGMAFGLVALLLGGRRFLGDIGMKTSHARERERRVEAGTTHDAPLAFTREEKERILVIAILALFTIVFWAAFEQAGGLMSLYTDEKVDRHVFGWEMPTAWAQGFNPLFILLLAPIGSALWSSLAHRGKDLTTAAKMGLGLLFLSVGFMLMMRAAWLETHGAKPGLGWVAGAFFFHTAGEVCLSPIGLSMVTKLAPVRLGSMMMGVWFASQAVAEVIAGRLGATADRLGDFRLFTVIVVVTFGAGLVLLALSKRLTRWMHGRA